MRLESTLRRCFTIALLIVTTTGVLPAADLGGFIRGDCNGDGSRNVSDPIFLLEALFGNSGVILGCEDACDVNDDGDLDLGDAVELLGFVFSGNPAGFPEPALCGFDPTIDTLGCDVPTCFFTVAEEREFTLETARTGLPYLGDLPEFQTVGVTWSDNMSSGVITEAVPFEAYGLPLGTALPGDLQLDPTTGVITGTTVPAGLHAIDFWAQTPTGETTLIHASLPSFSADETEIVPGQDFTQGGFFFVALRDETFSYTHPLPWPHPWPLHGCNPIQPPVVEQFEQKGLRIYYPLTAVAPTPLFIFHHGTGFDSLDYQQLMVHLASRGITCVSVEDQFPYFEYTDYYCWGGHDEAARVLVHARGLVEGYAEDPAHPLFERVDFRRVFYGGHSRGGASAMAACEIDPDVRGVIMLQGTDARQDSLIGNTDRWIDLPDVPVLSVSAEQDTDVIYPFAERLLERFRGPATMASIYGGCHGYSTDTVSNGCGVCTWDVVAPEVDSCRYIDRALQIDWTQHLVTAFFQRHAFGDLSVEGLLYGDELEGSPYVGVSYRRNLSGALTVADFDAFPLTNGGGLITETNTLLFIKGACYDWPFPIPSPIEAISNLVIIADPFGVTTIDLPIDDAGQPIDVTGRKKLTFRLKNHDIHGVPDNFGFGHLDFDLVLSDAGGASATIAVDPHLPQIAFHPDPITPGSTVPMKYQRFLSVTIDLDEFTAANPLIDFTALTGIEFIITTNGTASVDVRMGFDDIQFE